MKLILLCFAVAIVIVYMSLSLYILFIHLFGMEDQLDQLFGIEEEKNE